MRHNDSRGGRDVFTRALGGNRYGVEHATAVRIARNDAIFRDANERIRDRAADHDVTESIPFLCECAEPSCTTIVRLPLAEYERIRADPTWFFNATGHSAVAGPWATPVESPSRTVVSRSRPRRGGMSREKSKDSFANGLDDH